METTVPVSPGETTACLLLATSIAVICLYTLEYPLWLGAAVPAAALVLWCCSGSTGTHPVRNHQSRTTDETTSLLRSHPRPSTETPSRVTSSQPSYTSRSSSSSTQSVIHTAPDSSFRVVVDPGLSRHSTPTIAVDPRLLRYATPNLPLPAAADTRRTPNIAVDPRLLQYATPNLPLPAAADTRRSFHSNLASTSLMATTERQLAMARYGSQHICFTPTATPAPLRTPAPAPLRTPVPAPLRTPVPAPLRTPVPAPLRAPVPAPTRTTVPAPPRALAHAPLRALAPSPPRAHVPAPFRAPIIAPIPEPVARQEVDGLFLHEAVEATVSDRYPYDQQVKTTNNRYSRKRLVKGYFRCHNCKSYKHQLPGPRTWDSNAICVEIWMSSSGHRYRTQLHSQMCANCHKYVEPDVDKDDYVTAVVKVLDQWTGQNSDVKPRQKSLKTGPHQTDKCNACLKGVCPLKPAQ